MGAEEKTHLEGLTDVQFDLLLAATSRAANTAD